VATSVIATAIITTVSRSNIFVYICGYLFKFILSRPYLPAEISWDIHSQGLRTEAPDNRAARTEPDYPPCTACDYSTPLEPADSLGLR
jgi:hypothetical protein